MAHAWQFHFGKPGRRGYHNKEWANKMESIGLMPSSTGSPGGAKTGDKMADYPIADGLFIQKATELINSGFGISWLDRYPIRVNTSIKPLMTTDELIDPSTGLDTAVDPNSLNLIFMETKENKSNRLKYRCDSCGSQVWGKPGLSLICGQADCDYNHFIVVSI